MLSPQVSLLLTQVQSNQFSSADYLNIRIDFFVAIKRICLRCRHDKQSQRELAAVFIYLGLYITCRLSFLEPL